MKFDWQTHNRKQYRYSLLIVLLLIVAGVFIEYFAGSIAKTWFSFPNNIFIAFSFITIFTILFFVFRNSKWITLFSSVPFAISITVTLGILTIALGSINIKNDHPASLLYRMGLDNITTTWYFGFIFLLLLINLWFAILKRSLILTFTNITFLLNHFGLWLTLFAGVLGQGDLMRLTMQLKKDMPEWRALDEQNNLRELPLAFELKKFTMDVYPNKLYIINEEGNPLPLKSPASFLLEENKKQQNLLDYQITVHQFLPNAVLVKEKTWAANPMWGATNAAYITIKNLKTGKQETQWVAAGNFQFPPQTIQLSGNQTLVMAPAEAKKFESEVVVYEKGKETHTTQKIQVNHPISVSGWKIYQTSYDEKLGRWSDVSVVELVSDPWLPLVYTGIFLLMAGSIAFLLKNRH